MKAADPATQAGSPAGLFMLIDARPRSINSMENGAIDYPV
jgi:hypothetical protein